MIAYPKMKEKPSLRQQIQVFKGYNRSEKISSGEFCEMENLTSDDYPVLSVRKKRGLVKQLDHGCTGMLYVPGKGLFYLEDVVSNSVLYLLTANGESDEITRLIPGEKRMVLMGTKLIFAPDMIWVDIDDFSTGSMGETWNVSSGIVTAQLCDAEGNVYSNVTTSPEPPSAPGYHQLWLCNAVGNVGLKQYEPLTSEWVNIAATYVKISGLGDHRFQTGDGVKISGLINNAISLNGSVVIQHISHGEIIIPGILFLNASQDCSKDPITIERKVPKLEFMVECGNRLWGCKRDTNEIYACKLGDYKNWNCFQGLSTDSWVGSIGTPGPFTGAIVQNGYPIFYKTHCKHKVWPSSTGAHQITTTVCQGLEANYEKSLAVLDGTVYYLSAFGVLADDGGGAVDIGRALGNQRWAGASGTIFDRKYYLAVSERVGEGRLLVYDIDRRLWHCENYSVASHITNIPRVSAGGNSLYVVSNQELWDLTGNTGEPEQTVSWFAETGDLGLALPEQKYISRITLRLCLEPGATMEIYAKYDREPTWVKLGQVYGTDLRSFSLPVRPRRCDQLRLKLQGTGMCKLYSITETLEKGSELP